ncbi:unnamed protein product [Ambrosiozyma monospora]|uniref:Unnamed protein product n=1 Tax=Ambrosiozyma monospora TaxID=43982 RepID=A0A9W7DGC3_AMBMO|nr:unnamed protein product [Ambrosiozyma monospora]
MRNKPEDNTRYDTHRNSAVRKTTFGSIQVNKNQKGNPLLPSLKRVSYTFNDKVKDVDYLVNSHCVAIFLSVKYHKLHPEYIYNKLKKLRYNRNSNNSEILKVVLLVLDTDANVDDSVREMNKMCLFNDLSLVVCSNYEQAAEYLTCLKSCESNANAAKRLIKGGQSEAASKNEDMAKDADYYARVVDTLTSVQRINKTDSINLISKFGSMADLCAGATEETLGEVQGMGRVKVEQLLSVINEPFVYK